MAFEIPEHFHQSYTTNVEMLLRRLGPTLLPYVTMASYSGESAQVVKQFGDVAFREKTTRHADTVFDDLIHKQRWIFPADFVLTLPVDSEDTLRMLDSPLSPYAEAGRLAYGKKIDDIIFPAFFGTAQTGKRGVTATGFTAGNVVEVDLPTGADRGLTIEKLRKSRLLMKQKHIDLKADRPYIGVNARAMDDLLSSTTVTSADFNTVKALVSGEINTFMGFEFVSFEGITQDANLDFELPVWVKSAITYGMWNNLETRIGERADKDYLTQIHMKFTAGATRVNEDKVFKILTDDGV